MKKCPYCAEEIQDEAVKCRHCNEFLTARFEAPKTRGFGKTAILILSFLTVGPFALPLVWFNSAYTRRTKIIVTVIVLTLTFVLVAAFLNAARMIYGYYKDAGIF
jgi:hypothetical protein